jgi:hypothetical protein
MHHVDSENNPEIENVVSAQCCRTPYGLGSHRGDFCSTLKSVASDVSHGSQVPCQTENEIYEDRNNGLPYRANRGREIQSSPFSGAKLKTVI